ncbi:MAG: MBL fold metallo-hydrolase [Oscillospiraceae bacterium]|jgi:phosphoribosyl 1,2-cyclic phosphodiesterase|nr:MBL fold metallo-hydrolase [Oscillospiraceae bacterium]
MSFVFCPLFSGSSGNALYVGADDTHLLVDAGMPLKAILAALDGLGVAPQNLRGILVTHEHSDHIRAAGALSRKFNLPVYANEGTWQAMADKLGEVAPRNQRVFTTGQDFYVENLGVAPFAIPHDAAEPVGLALHARGRKVAVATDLGHIQSGWMRAVSGADLLLLEANYDLNMLENSRYPTVLKQRIRGRKGHLSNEDCGKALCALAQSGVRTCVLGHLSRENNLPELAYQTVRDALLAQDVPCGAGFRLDLAWRDRVGERYVIA